MDKKRLIDIIKQQRFEYIFKSNEDGIFMWDTDNLYIVIDYNEVNERTESVSDYSIIEGLDRNDEYEILFTRDRKPLIKEYVLN